MDACVFCEIPAGGVSASAVFRDGLCTAFMDIQPKSAGYVLVVPDEHAAYLKDLPEDTGTHRFRTAQRVAAALYESGLDCEGINHFLDDGEAAGQEVFHARLHVFPRFAGDGFGPAIRRGPAEKNWRRHPTYQGPALSECHVYRPGSVSGQRVLCVDQVPHQGRCDDTLRPSGRRVARLAAGARARA